MTRFLGSENLLSHIRVYPRSKVFEPSISDRALLHVVNLDEAKSDSLFVPARMTVKGPAQRREDSGLERIVRRESVRT